MQAALDLDAGNLDFVEERLPSARRKEHVASPHQRKQLQRDFRKRSRRQAQLSRRQGRNVKRQLATLARTMRNWSREEQTQLSPMSSSSSASGEQQPSSCVGILQWWSQELREHLEAELEMMSQATSPAATESSCHPFRII